MYNLQKKNRNHKSLAGVHRPPAPLNNAPVSVALYASL